VDNSIVKKKIHIYLLTLSRFYEISVDTTTKQKIKSIFPYWDSFKQKLFGTSFRCYFLFLEDLWAV